MIRYLALGAPVVATAKLVAVTRHRKSNAFLSAFDKDHNKGHNHHLSKHKKHKKGDAHYLNKVSINGEVVYNLDNAASGEVEKCYAVEGVKSVEVCGIQFRTLVYLKNDCSKADSHMKEVKTCDATKPADTCVTVTDDSGVDTAFFSNALSYEILPCDPEVEAPPVDLSGHEGADVSEAEEQADADVAEAELAAETAVAESEPAPSPAPPSAPPSPPETPAEPDPTPIPTPKPQGPPMTVGFTPADPVIAEPAPPPPPPPPPRVFTVNIPNPFEQIVQKATEVHHHVANVFKSWGW